MNCPHCAKPIAPALIRAAANSIAGSAKRPGATGLVRNPKGKPKCLCSLCELRPRDRACAVLIDGEPENICKDCYAEACFTACGHLEP